MARSPHLDAGSRLLALRLSNSRLTGAAFRSPEAAVGWLGAVQAQDYAGAKWAVGQRVRGAFDADVERSLESGRLLRTHVLRPTWHFVLPEDIRWLLSLTAPRIRASMAYYDREFELDEATFRRSNAAIEKALRGGKSLTRSELSRALFRARIVASGQRLGRLMMRAELDALVCSGPRRGKQFSYALLDERAPPTKPLAREEGLVTLARRYVRSHGPCLVHDFSWWSGLSLADAKAAIEALKPELEQLLLDDKTYWFADSKSAPGLTDATLHLLPNFDEYLIAYKDRGPVLDGTSAKGRSSEGNVLGAHVIVQGGKVVGSWRRTLEKSALTVELTLLESLSQPAQQALRAEAARYAQFLGLPLRLTLNSVRRKASA